MARVALLLSAALALVVAVALVLVPFDARLGTVARDGTPLALTVGLRCEAPVLGLDLGPGGSDEPRPCTRRARQRVGGGLAVGALGAALLAGGLRRRQPPSGGTTPRR